MFSRWNCHSGVVRDKVGDIMVQGEAGAQVLLDPELVDHFEMSLVQVSQARDACRGRSDKDLERLKRTLKSPTG